MTRIALVLVLGSLVLVPGALAAPRYSGTLVSVDPAGTALTLDEIGVGLRPGKNDTVQREIRLSPATKISLAARAEEGGEGDWPGAYKETPLEAKDLRPGDFATVEAETQDGKLTAVSVVVVRPTSADR